MDRDGNGKVHEDEEGQMCPEVKEISRSSGRSVSLMNPAASMGEERSRGRGRT